MVERLKAEWMCSLDWVLVPWITPLECRTVWWMMLLEERQQIEKMIWIVWSLRVKLKVILPVVDGF